MAQISKYTIRQAVAVIGHAERTRKDTHKKINPMETYKNYALWPPECPDKCRDRAAMARLRTRLHEVSCLDREDVNVLCEWRIFLGSNVPPYRQYKQAFYRAAVKLMAMLYRPENVIYAWVHEDEAHSHLHFGFVPVVRKPRKLRKNASEATRKAYEEAVAAGEGMIERVDANALIGPGHLQGWHGWFRKYMALELGYDPGVHLQKSAPQAPKKLDSMILDAQSRQK